MIKLLTKAGQVIYELQQSEMFPDFSSVLKEAIALNINLKGLYIDSENIDGIAWQGNNLDTVTFLNCSMINNVFLECSGEPVFKGCNLHRVKINKCDFSYFSINHCNLTKASLRNSSLNYSSMMSCNLVNSVFFNCDANGLSISNCNLAHVLFEDCELNNSSIWGPEESAEWYSETKFINCIMNDADMNHITDISRLYFWDVDICKIHFENVPKITEISSTLSKVLIAVYDNVIWWKPNYFFGNVLKIPFKCTPEEFINEVESGYPELGIDLNNGEEELDDELRAVSNYLRSWL